MAVATEPGVAAGADPAAPLLSVTGLAVQYGRLRALDGIDLEVRAGESVALVGENGAGKSTLVRCIAGDRAPTTGQILVSGRRLPAVPAAAARLGVAVVWQDLALCDNLDVAANLLLGDETGRMMRSETRSHQAAAALLRDLRIPIDDTTRNVGTLSGGQRQLLAVARALRSRPRLLMLDEPTASLGVTESAQVEKLIAGLRAQGTTVLITCHDIDQMFRLADRIVVLRHGRVAADLEVKVTHPDDVVALISGQQVDSSARRQLSRLQGLVDRLSSADPSSSLPLILSALGTALGSDQLSIHLREGSRLRAGAFQGLSPALRHAWSELPLGPDGGPVGEAAATGAAVLDGDIRVSGRWAPYRHLAAGAGIASSWAVPVTGPAGLVGVIAVYQPGLGLPGRDELDLVTLYAGYAANAVERDRLLTELTTRNRALETIRDVLETLAGPVPLERGLTVALRALRHGLGAERVGLVDLADPARPTCRASAGPGDDDNGAEDDDTDLLRAAAGLVGSGTGHGRVGPVPTARGTATLGVTFVAPNGPTALVARWTGPGPQADGADLLEDAANSLRLALEREESARAQQETAALRRSQELQQGFLSRLSHELRTPLTAIRGYASSLMQSDVVWDGESQHRFLTRMAAESARLGRLVDDMLDFSAIEAGILRLQPDWCDLALVLEAAAGCLPPARAAQISVACQPDLPVVWADHDRLEQVFVNLMDNAVRHNPPGTRVWVSASSRGATDVVVEVSDDGSGVPDQVADSPFEPRRRTRSATAGAGLGLSITKGIVDAHGGSIELERRLADDHGADRAPVVGRATVGGKATVGERAPGGDWGGGGGSGTRFVIRLPVEDGHGA
jgi:signal transduction histidine kinase/ABC-type branched-subunit amino acid transport system ATPase component